MSHFPIELAHKIINYTGVVTFYKGKYYNKLPRDDPRYKMLASVIKKPFFQKVETINLLNKRYQASVHLKHDFGESYAGVRFILYYIFEIDTMGKIINHIFKLFRCGRDESYTKYFVWSMENCWCKTIKIGHTHGWWS